MKPTFKADENLPVEVAQTLRKAGFDAATVHEQRLAGRPDETLAEVCQAERRTMITLDLDFADIRQYPPEQYAGMIVLRPSSQDVTHIVSLVNRLLNHLDTEPLKGRLWIVNDHSLRIRSSPEPPGMP